MILELCGLLDYRLNPRTCQRISAKDSVVFWLMARLKRLIAKSGGDCDWNIAAGLSV